MINCMHYYFRKYTGFTEFLVQIMNRGMHQGEPNNIILKENYYWPNFHFMILDEDEKPLLASFHKFVSYLLKSYFPLVGSRCHKVMVS